MHHPSGIVVDNMAMHAFALRSVVADHDGYDCLVNLRGTPCMVDGFAG